MLPRKLSALGIGQKLIVFFSIGLAVVVFSTIISSFILHNIDESKNSLTESSIPALVSVNSMSTNVHDLIQSSLRMIEAKSIYELNTSKDKSFESIHEILIKLVQLKNNTEYREHIDAIKSILFTLEMNLNLEYDSLKNNMERKTEYNAEIILIQEALEAISQFVSLKKINIKAGISQQLEKLQYQQEYEEFTINSFSKIDIISELIARTAELRKDIRVIEEANTKQSVLAAQQEFDHSLRVITRTVVTNKDLQLQKEIGQHILTLIKLGQDTPDIFELRLKLIDTIKKVLEIHNENYLLTKHIYESVNELSDSVKVNTEQSAQTLSNIILNSKYIFYSIAIASCIIFLFIIIKFVYQDIVIRLSKLSDITNRLSKDDINIEIDTSGEDEFSKFAHALKLLKNRTKERRITHEKLTKQAKLLQRSNEDLSLFAYVASHDLQEPLRAISSYSQLLAKRYSNKLDKDADKFIDYVVSGCSRMEALIEGLLQFSRVDTQTANKESVWIEKILRDIKNDLKVKINETYSLVSWSDMPTIYADPIQIRTVFQNLISNAIKYNHSKPPKIHINSVKEGEFWKFRITDNGIGIDEKHHEKIFLIFKRLHSRNKYSGTGIGLSICKKIIERHGGEITLKSKPNEGTTFVFTLPVDDRFRLDNIQDIAA